MFWDRSQTKPLYSAPCWQQMMPKRSSKNRPQNEVLKRPENGHFSTHFWTKFWPCFGKDPAWTRGKMPRRPSKMRVKNWPKIGSKFDLKTVIFRPIFGPNFDHVFGTYPPELGAKCPRGPQKWGSKSDPNSGQISTPKRSFFDPFLGQILTMFQARSRLN